MSNTPFYTINEMINHLTVVMQYFNSYIQMMNSITAQINEMTAYGDDFAEIETRIEPILTDADSFLARILSSIIEIDLTAQFAHEVRVGALVFGASNPGHYHHAFIDIADDFAKWTIVAHNSEEGTVDAFDEATPTTGSVGLFLADDVVEISGIGDPYLEGFFTVSITGTSAIALVEANSSEVVDIDPAFDVVVRLRER